MSRKLFFPLLVAALLVVGCRVAPISPTPTPAPTPIPAPTPTPIPAPTPGPPVVQPPVVVEPQPTTNAIPRDVYNRVVEGNWLNSIEELRNVNTAIPPILQPDGAYLYRYRLLDSDAQWRQRHANFIVDGGVIVRKSIS